MRRLLCLLCVGTLPACTAAAQRADLPTRAGRVVLHSPHFDEPDPVRGGLNCSASPLALYGFEGATVKNDAPAQLLVRVYRQTEPEPGTRLIAVLPGVQLQLTQRLQDGIAHDLPLQMEYAGITGPDGSIRLQAPPGFYRVKAMSIGFRGGEGIVHLRPWTRDSLHIRMDVSAICSP
jgi:hypothetical protein